MKNMWLLTVMLFLLSIQFGFSQESNPGYFAQKEESEVIKLLDAGGFTIKNSLAALPDSLIDRTLICNRLVINGESRDFEPAEFLTFQSNSFTLNVTSEINRYLKCNSIKYIFNAETAISPCVVFVCTEGFSIFVLTPKTDLIPSSLSLFYPPTDGTKHLVHMFNLIATGMKASGKSSFKFGTGTAAAPAVRKNTNPYADYEKYGKADMRIWVRDNNIDKILDLFDVRPGFLKAVQTYGASYLVDEPLVQAVMDKNTEIISIIMKYDGDPNVIDQLPDGYARKFASDELDRYFRVYECIPQDGDYDKILQLIVDKIDLKEALNIAASYENIRLFEGLKSLHPAFQSSDLSSYLGTAIYYERVKAVQWLLANGADPMWKDSENKSNLENGLKSKSKEIKAIFKELKSTKKG